MKKRFVGVRSIGAAVAALSVAVMALPAVSSTLSSAASAVPGLSALSTSPAAAANPALSCAAGTAYNVTAGGSFYVVNTATGANTAAAPSTIGSGESSVNALAITSNGQTAYTADNNVSGGTTKIDIENITTGTSTTVSGVPATNISSGNLVAGGIDPLNGDYYYGGWNSAGSIFTLFKFNGTTGTEVGTITPSGASLTFAHGDLAFDNSGNMYLLAGDTALDAGLLLSVSASNLPSSGTSAIPNSLLTTIKAPSGDSENYAGMTFESDSYLYVVTNDNPSLLYKVNPNTGVVSSGYPINQTGISDPSDMASCSYSGSLTLQKNVVGRVAASDQFNLSITGNGITGGNTATTTGTATGVQAAKAGPVVGIPAQTYTIAETAASGSLSNYSTTYSCLNGSASFASGSGTSVALPAFPAASGNAGAQIVCTFTNTPATLSISKATTTTSVTNVGDTINYPYTVTNTGPVSLTNVSVADNPIAPAGALTTGPTCTGLTNPTASCTSTSSTTLAAGQTATFSATYKVTQADLNNGSVNDTSTATGTPPGGGTITGTSNQVTVPANQNTGLTITKTPSPTSVSTLGAPVTYTFVVTNTSNVTLNGVSVADTQSAPAGSLASGPTCQSLTHSFGLVLGVEHDAAAEPVGHVHGYLQHDTG